MPEKNHEYFSLMKTTGVISLMLFELVMLSCKKEPPPTIEQMLTAHAWQVEDVILYDTMRASNPVSVMLPCDRDNRVEFFPDGRVEMDYGPESCDSTGHQRFSGRWEFDSGIHILEMFTVRYELTLISGRHLRLLLRKYLVPGLNRLHDVYFTFRPAD